MYSIVHGTGTPKDRSGLGRNPGNRQITLSSGGVGTPKYFFSRFFYFIIIHLCWLSWMSRRRTRGGDDHVDESLRLSLGNHKFWRSWEKVWSSSVENGILSNIIKCHTKTTLNVRQMEDHVGPGLARSVPTICVLFRTLRLFIMNRWSES